VAGSYDDFEDDFELGEDMPELQRGEAEAEEEENQEHKAKIAQIEEMAAAYAKLDEAEDKALEKEPERTDPDDAGRTGAPYCSHVDQFFCTLRGPLSKSQGADDSAPRTIKREAMSQRLELMSPMSKGAEDGEERAA